MARRSFLVVDNNIMQKNQSFRKSGLEGNLYQYLPENRGSSSNNNCDTLAAHPNDLNFLPAGTASDRFGFQANNKKFQHVSVSSNTETFKNKNNFQHERASFNSYENFSNNYGKPSPKTTEFIPNNYQKNDIIDNSSRYGHVPGFGNNNSNNLNYTGNYADFSNNYGNEDQLRNNTLLPLKKEEFIEVSVNGVGNTNDFGTFGPYDDVSTNYNRFFNYQRDTGPLGSNSIHRNSHDINHNFGGPSDFASRNYDCYSSNIIEESEFQLRTNSLPNNRQIQFVNGGHSDERTNNYIFDDGNEWKCVRNPEYFPELCRDNEHFSRDIRNEKQYRSNAISRKVRRHSEESTRSSGFERTRRSNYRRKGSISREENTYENSNKFVPRRERRRERFRRNSRDERYTKVYDSHGSKHIKVDRTHEVKPNRKYSNKKEEKLIGSRSASFKKSSNSNQTDGDLPHPSHHSSANHLSNKIEPISISELESLSAIKSRRQINRERTLLIRKLKRKRISELRERKKADRIKKKALELKYAVIINKPAKGHIKYEPEKYWKEWWSKFAYIEKVVEKVDYDDETKGLLKFNYDLNKIDLDGKVSAILSKGVSGIKKAEHITEINYESRTGIYKTLKYKKLLEDKDFQTFLLTREKESLTQTLESFNNNKILLALLYQSIIYRWHNSMRLIKSEEMGLVSQVTEANTLINDKLFQYLVLDSIYELKKLTQQDWSGFDEFYNNLK